MSSVEQPEEPADRFYPPEEGLRRARPLPPREERGLGDDMTDEEVGGLPEGPGRDMKPMPAKRASWWTQWS